MLTRPRTRVQAGSVVRAAALAALLSACCGAIAAWLTPGTAARQDPTLTKLIELNRNGKWDEAARLAQGFLARGARRPVAQRCEALQGLAYAQTRLGMSAEASETLASFDKGCENLPPHLSWVKAETARLRSELAGRPRAGTARAGTARPRPAPVPADDFWQTADPAAVGLDAEALKRHAGLCLRTGADACLVVYKGRIVQELYGPRYRQPMMAMSSTKSVTGLLVGALLDDGKIKSVDEPVCKYVEEWCAGAKAKVTLRHLLTMTSGLTRLRGESVGFVGDKNPFVIKQPLAAEPGSAWAYSNEGVQLLSPVIDRAAGEPAQDYARRRLFEPLGMRGTRLHLDEKGHAWTYADMETTPRDLARLGLLMLNRGVWRGQRVLSETWVSESTRPAQQLKSDYGLLWWLIDSPPGYAALGHLDTNLYVFPSRELIVVRMQSRPIDPQPPYHDEALSIFKQLTTK